MNHANDNFRLLLGDCLTSMKTLPDKSVHCCVTSPPYFGLRDYGVAAQIGLEQSPDEFVQALVAVFREVRRVLRDDGTLWLNLGDSWNGKNLRGIPWRVAFALQDDGWILRQDIIWHKPNPMPESTKDRCTKAHEYVFLFAKSERYFYDAEAVREPNSPDMQRRAAAGHTRGSGGKLDASRQDHDTLRGDHAKAITANGRNRRGVWSIPVASFKGAHFAVFPPDLVEPCILAGCPKDGTVLDPFGGSGTTAGVALAHGRAAILCELNRDYAELMPARIASIMAKYAPERPSNDNKQMPLTLQADALSPD